MYILDKGFKKWAKITCRAGQVLAIVLIWQATHSPLMGQFGSTVQQFPQVVLNGGSTTSFTIHNPNAEKPIDVDVQLYSPGGGALTDGHVELGPGETETVSFGDASAPLTRGWAELKSDDEFIATEFFQLFLAGLKPRVGVLPSPAAEEIKFLGFVNEQFKSGLAVHNPSPTEATEITLRLKDNAGQEPVTEKKLTLAPLQSEAAFLNEALLFGPSLSSFEGVVEISVNSPPVAVLSLIQEAGGDVATVAVETRSHVVTDPSNTAIGRGALVSNTVGDKNTAIGVNALTSNTEGDRNTATGFQSLFRNRTGRHNTANGDDALFSNSEGSFNAANGTGALTSNTVGNRNTASGAFALRANSTGNFNSASGASALLLNTEGSDNTASGASALRENTSGNNNTASGRSALFSNTKGNDNTASGAFALYASTTGSDNIAIGGGAGSSLVTGDNNIYVGNSGETEESNFIRIGNLGHANAFIAGVQLVPASSRQFKQDIHDMDRASTDLMRLRPVTFRYKKEHDFAEGRLQYGLVAEEVAEVYPELVVHDDTGQAKTVEYQKLPAMLLNELQKQHQQIQEQKEQVQEQQARIQSLMERVTLLEEDPTAEPPDAPGQASPDHPTGKAE